MKNDKHTPGPWFIHDGKDFELCDEDQLLAFSDETGNYCIASVDNDERGQANAALIARAPLLIECQEVIERLMTWRQNETPDELTENARALLAKLDGE